MRSVSIGVCLWLMSATLAAQGHEWGVHVRAESPDVRALIADTATHSPTFRSLVQTIDASDVIVYVRVRMFATQALDGRIGFLATRVGVRFLAIELACPRSPWIQMATLAHELQHAAEIASAPWVVGAVTLAQYYGTIGERVNGDGNGVAFETDAARAIGARVRHELTTLTPAAPAR